MRREGVKTFPISIVVTTSTTAVKSVPSGGKIVIFLPRKEAPRSSSRTALRCFVEYELGMADRVDKGGLKKNRGRRRRIEGEVSSPGNSP